MAIYTTPEYLDLYKKSLDLDSDYQLGQAWQITRAYISQLRRGKQFLTPEQCEDIAAATGIPLAKVLTDVQVERAKTPLAAATWRTVANMIEQRHASRIAPALAVFSVVSGGLADTWRSAICILCKIPGRLRTPLALPRWTGARQLALDL